MHDQMVALGIWPCSIIYAEVVFVSNLGELIVGGKMKASMSILVWCATVVWSGLLQSVVDAQGSWQTVVNNAGIASMHTAVTHYGNVVLLDRTNIGPSQLPATKCRDNPADLVSVNK